MRQIRLFAALAYGFFLFHLVWVWFGGFMAARQVPAEYFALFGTSGQGLAHAILGIGLHLLPTVALVALGVLVPLRVVQRGQRALGAAVVLGLAVGLAFTYGSALTLEPGAGAVLAQYFRLPWWAWPAVAAPLIAISVVAVGVLRLPVQRAVA